MTARQLHQLQQELQQEQFVPATFHPLHFAVERALFKKKQLQRLLAAAQQVKGAKKTVQRRVVRWQRQLKRLERVPDRIKETHPLEFESLFKRGESLRTRAN